MRAFLLVLAIAATTWAGEPQPDPATLHLPADVFAVVKFASPERINVIGKDLQPLLPVERRQRSLGEEVLSEIHGAHRMPIDRARPFYFAVSKSGAQWVFHALEGADQSMLPASSTPARLNAGMIRLGEIEEVGVTRAVPLPILAGDVSVCVPVRQLVDANRDLMKKAVGDIAKLDRFARQQGFPVPPALIRLVQVAAEEVLKGAMGVEDVHYSLTWRNPKLESEGWIRSREGSTLRGWLGGLAPRAPSDLMGLMPDDALWMVESNGLAAAMDGALASVFERAFGEGAGSAVLWLFSPSSALHEHLTGRAVGTVHLYGMAAASIQAVHEIKRDARMDKVLAAVDFEQINARFKALELPIEVQLERGYGSFRKTTALHRLSYRSADPQLAMLLAQMQICFAVDGRYLVVTQSPAGGSVLTGLLGQIRDNQPAAHPHLEAMARLMPDRHESMTINAGAIKPLMALFGMASPEMAKVIQAMPDELYFSTALALRDGHIHIRGDWPLLELAKFIAGL